MIGKLQRRLPMLTADPVELSSRLIDERAGGADVELDESTNRITNTAVKLTDQIGVVESFSHIVAFETGEGLVCFDSSGPMSGPAAVAGLRTFSENPVHTCIYTHGHIDHVGGSGALNTDAEVRGVDKPRYIAHTNVGARFDRYLLTNGYNNDINARQFGGISKANGIGVGSGASRFLPEDVAWPDVEVEDSSVFEVGGTSFELFHDKGETDDHLWAWVPEHKALCVGDFVTWVFPNCGNPQKVQRFPKEWAAALRKMASLNAEWLLGAHGLAVNGRDRVATVLNDLATALETLVVGTIELMNQGAPLDHIVQAVTIDEAQLTKPWMRPVYDEPEFVVRNIWRLYGGWWDKNPANLKPAPFDTLASEVTLLAGGGLALAARARELAAAGDLRTACHLIEFAAAAEPSPAVHEARAEIYQTRRDNEASLMSKGIFAAAANDSRIIAEDPAS